MIRKDHCPPVNAKFVSVGYIFFDKQPEFESCHEQCHPVCERDTSDCSKSTANKDFAQ